MPTIRNGLAPLAVFPAPKGKKRTKRVSIFPAEHWDKWGGKPGLYRIMQGEAWMVRAGERVSFYTQDEVEAFGGRWVLQALGARRPAEGKPAQMPHPALRDRCRCRWIYTGSDGFARGIQCFTKCEPIQSSSGEWMIYLDGGLGWKPCAEVTPLNHFGKPIPHPEAL